MTDTATSPVYRVRISHAHTLKEGWRLSETTVECTFGGNENPDAIAGEIAMWLDRVSAVGELEARKRGHLDHLAARYEGDATKAVAS